MLGTGEKARKSMKSKTQKKIEYTDEPMDNVELVADFLPSPEELAFREETVKITISLSKKSVDFFKDAAQVHGTQYQKMIRNLLDHYVVSQRGQSDTWKESS